ncbi:MAG: GAP family protein [Cyanobacteriota bacterium]
MNSLLGSLALIALIDSINPNAMAVQVYLLSTPKPVVRSIAFILGDFAATWMAGLLLTFGITQVITQMFNLLGDVMYVLQFILGVVLIVIGYHLSNFANQLTTTKRPRSLKPIHTFQLGATMAFVEAPTALPYLTAIEQITREDLQLPELLGVLAFYNLIFVFPLIVLLGMYLVLRNSAATLLNNIHQLVTKWFPKIMCVIIIVLGFVLIADCIAHILGHSIV